METNHGGGAESASAERGFGQARSVPTEEIQALIADVEDLIKRISDLKDADVVRLRDRVMQAVGNAKDSIAGGADRLRHRARTALGGADDYVRESPWAAIGLAAVVGAVVGLLVSRRS